MWPLVGRVLTPVTPVPAFARQTALLHARRDNHRAVRMPTVQPYPPVAAPRTHSTHSLHTSATTQNMAASKCPVAHGQLTPATGGRPSQWWPNSLPLHVLHQHQHTPSSSPTPPGFNYADAFNKLDLAAVKKDIEKVCVPSCMIYKHTHPLPLLPLPHPPGGVGGGGDQATA